MRLPQKRQGDEVVAAAIDAPRKIRLLGKEGLIDKKKLIGSRFVPCKF
jgi:hypothetical protein